MAIKQVYERFLSTPTADVLTRNVSLNYITTTTSVTGSEEVIKHLNSQQKTIKKKGDKILSIVQTADTLVLDVETTLEFLTGGGAYLPSLDDNFLADRVVTFPTIHIVRFNSQSQISQVRIYWDQGSLLKQVEVIGARGKNWPIRDAQDQAKLIVNVATAQGLTTPPSQESGQVSSRPPSRTATASDIFASSDEVENDSTPRARDSIISPRAGATKHFRPVRVFGEDDTEDATTSSPVKPKLGSNKGFQPVRVFDVEQTDDASHHARAGSTKNFQPIRVFDVEGGAGGPEEKERQYKTHPNKFNHFEIGAEANAEREIKPNPAVRSRPMSQWDFADFYTPEKPRQKIRAQDVRHFGWSDNEDENVETPPVRTRHIQPRRDAETHFHLDETDDENYKPEPVHPGKRMIGSYHNKGLDLYDNNVYDEEGNPTPNDPTAAGEKGGKQPLGTVPNNINRRKDFDSHWEVRDPTPDDTTAGSAAAAENDHRPVSADRVKAVKMMESSWDKFDEADPQEQEKEKKTTPLPKRASRAVFQPSWSLGDE
ncbi:conserved hypothetical protein [Talaromyces stipitatus ATCC 10500]|uniref:Uncharacterized protein n=1 Tax=Talaromyces stipitatus (strain ATCC 10500 / CBS 375.48 / QM 6759 / NRRL 1006) TaxID=441959 RepID=B8MQK7_TALSN|nr:uncharacterized protein TSTA_058960 [Talaromyces stipitatus ATCC 10500]EED13409.1 conserved hypothetical protein [Talaromyces stipitatus ATCC 10500]